MAVAFTGDDRSAAVHEKLQGKTGLDLIWESRLVFAEIFLCFRECHDLCEESGFFDHDAIVKVDECAVDFRRLSLDSVSVAKRVSDQWLDTALITFENIQDIENPKAMFELLGDQAKELSRCFKVIASWARDLAARFHAAQNCLMKEADEFKRYYENVYKEAEAELRDLQWKMQEIEASQQLDKRVDKGSSKRKEATYFNPFKFFKRRAGSSRGSSDSVKANNRLKPEQLKQEEDAAVQEAREKLQGKRTHNERAKV